MVMIPSSVFYFIFGFVSCLVLIIAWVIVSVHKENKKRKELLDKFTTDFVDSINNKNTKDNE